MTQQISEHQKNLLEVVAEEVNKMETTNDVQYALKGLLAEISHLATGEYFDPNYIYEKCGIIFRALKSDYPEGNYYQKVDEEYVRAKMKRQAEIGGEK